MPKTLDSTATDIVNARVAFKAAKHQVKVKEEAAQQANVELYQAREDLAAAKAALEDATDVLANFQENAITPP
jgi:hypothetical protein